MILNEPSVVNLIKAAAPVGEDVIANAVSRVPVSDLTALADVLGEPLLVPLPGPVLAPGTGNAFGVLNAANDLRANDCRAVWFCDVRILNEEGFPFFLKKHGISEFILPFSDCAIEGEYGYRRSYECLSSLRADGVRFHVTALTDRAPDQEQMRRLFGSNACTFFSDNKPVLVSTEKMDDEETQFSVLATICEKFVFHTTAILFQTRLQAEHFANYLRKRFTPFSLVHGGLDQKQNLKAVSDFVNGESNVLLATKHILGAAPFLSADQLVFCGLPYSETHLRRILSICKTNEALCEYTDEDVERIRKLIYATPEELTYDREAVVFDRASAFEDFLQTRVLPNG
ncbi:MAG: hypothetical protein IK104_11770 [Clostridia bacterium]|nr:hypothetical protein [Clostridia bacterium]